MVSYHLPQFPLIFVIGIAGNADQFDALGIGEGPAEIPAVFFDLLLAGGRFFYVQFAARLLPDLPAVQPGGHQPLAGALVQVVNLFLRLGKGKADLFGGKVGSVAVQCIHDAADKTVGCIAAGPGRCAGLPLQGLPVGIRVDVWFLQKTQVHAAVVQLPVQGAALVRAAAHAGNTVEHDGVPRLHGVQQFVQLFAALAGCAGVNFTDDVRCGVSGGNVAHLALYILAWCRNTAVPKHGHGSITSDVHLI